MKVNPTSSTAIFFTLSIGAFIVFLNQFETQNFYLFFGCCWDKNLKGVSPMNISMH